MNRFFFLAVIGMVVLCCASVGRSAEVLEEPIAIVGEHIILRSEWETQLSLFGMQTRQDLSRPAVRDSLGAIILDQMINDLLLLIVAEEDTLLSVSSEEIDAALKDHLTSLRRRFKTEAEFQEGLAGEGLTERDLRVRYRSEVEKQLLKQKLMQRKLAQVAVSHGEVREFYEYYKDSLPTRPAGIKIAHILYPIEVSQPVIDSTREALRGVLEEIHGGLSFEDAARQYSQDATSGSGGDLGWFSKGQMVPAFEQAAFALTPGQISGVVRSPFGWHLIQCVEREAERVHARHIIVTLNPTAADSAAVFARADSAAVKARAGEDFCTLAQEHSSDEESRKNCGELGWYPLEEMFEEFKVVLRDAVAGDIRGPVATEFGWHVIRVLDRRAMRKLNLEEDWDGIKEIARQDKTNRILAEWIEEIREGTFVEIRPLSGQVSLGSGSE